MPIKKRTFQSPPAEKIGPLADMDNYAAFRNYWWLTIDRTEFNYRGAIFIRPDGTRNSLTSTAFVLQPRFYYPLKDVWHCGSVETAKAIVQKIVAYPDIHGLELRGKWVWVDCAVSCGLLEGQPVDERTKYRGR